MTTPSPAGLQGTVLFAWMLQAAEFGMRRLSSLWMTTMRVAKSVVRSTAWKIFPSRLLIPLKTATPAKFLEGGTVANPENPHMRSSLGWLARTVAHQENLHTKFLEVGKVDNQENPHTRKLTACRGRT